MPRTTVAQAVVTWLANQHVERDGHRQRFFEGVFGIFGHGNVAGMGEALEAAQDSVRYYQTRNEQAMVHTAAAFAKQSRRLRTFACTTSIGPGATNLVTGAANATVNRLPVLLLPGDRFATRRVKPVLQQLERPEAGDLSVNDALRPVSRYFDRIERPEMLIDALPAAMRVLTSPAETGAVTLALPQDVQAEAWDWPDELLAPRTWVVAASTSGRGARWPAAAERIAAAQRPMIVAGGGVIYSDASAALDAFARRFGIPVTETQAGKGALPWDHPLQLGALGSAGGSGRQRHRPRRRPRHRHRHPAVRLPDHELVRVAGPEVRLRGHQRGRAGRRQGGVRCRSSVTRGSPSRSSQAALEARGWRGASADRLALVERLRGEWNAEVERVRHLVAASMSRSRRSSASSTRRPVPTACVVCAAGGLPGDLHKIWRASGPETYHLEYGYSTMGYEIAGGLGVAMAEPARRVFVMVGDGSYLMLANEIVTACQERIAMTIVLLDNHGFRCIRNLSAACGGDNPFNDFRFRDPASGTFTGDVLPIDFAANAASLGARVLTADTPAELERALADRGRHRGWTRGHRRRGRPRAVGAGLRQSWWDVPVAEVSTSRACPGGSPRIRGATWPANAPSSRVRGRRVRHGGHERLETARIARAASRSRQPRARGGSSRRPRMTPCSSSRSRCSTRWRRPATPARSSDRPATSGPRRQLR